MPVTGRERILTALDGGRPDRVPRALGFSRVDLEALAPPDQYRDDLVDVRFIRFGESPGDEQLRRLVRTAPVDTHLGTPAQITNYARWEYHPESAERRNPLARARSLQELRDFPFPDAGAPDDVGHMARQVRELHERGLAAGGSLPHLGGELFEPAWRLRGLRNFLLDLVERPDWAHLLLDRLAGLARAKAQALARAGVDVLSLGDDVGMPRSMMIGPAQWGEFFKPRMASIIEAARAIKADLRVLYHSDGFYEPIIGDLIDVGVDAINPVQPEHMDAARIRRRFGTRVALWGTVGHHSTLVLGAPEDIRREVRRRIESLGRAGLILCPAYDIWPDIPWANVAAFLDAVEMYGR
ncbi:MAG: uroporphyrinogen decarboxylase family protein [Armatimonadota bacterium]|nr:uroporphyrinogen decarboxylase family protein [Armatimonadota bacterium]